MRRRSGLRRTRGSSINFFTSSSVSAAKAASVDVSPAVRPVSASPSFSAARRRSSRRTPVSRREEAGALPPSAPEADTESGAEASGVSSRTLAPIRSAQRCALCRNCQLFTSCRASYTSGKAVVIYSRSNLKFMLNFENIFSDDLRSTQ